VREHHAPPVELSSVQILNARNCTVTRGITRLVVQFCGCMQEMITELFMGAPTFSMYLEASVLNFTKG
jgi:hypothetical protein